MRQPTMNIEDYDKGAPRLQEAINQMGYDSLRPGQQTPIDCIMYGRDTICILPTGAGKCLAKDTPVLMMDGTIKLVQDIKQGDLLMGPDSTPRSVLSTTQGKARLFYVTPVEGDAFRVNEEHLLTVRITDGAKNVKSPAGQVLSGGEVLDISVRDYLASSKTFKHCAKLIRASVEFEAQEEPELDPYLVGLHLCTNNRTHSESERNECAGDKHIGNTYKLGSRQVRLELLAGLLDGAGYLDCRTKSTFEILVKFDSLANDILFVARSLGFASYSVKRKTPCSTTGVEVCHNVITISGDTSEIPTELAHKKAQPRLQKKSALHVGFTVTEDEVGEYYGFMLDGDGRFLLGDFTVTHNSAIFALPTIAMEWKTIVFSPLIALMRDQVQSMNRAGIRTGCINSNQTEMQNYSILREWAEGQLQMLYVAPERLSNPQFKQALVSVRPDFVVLDECICPESVITLTDRTRKAHSVECGDVILSLDENNKVTTDTVKGVCYKGIRPVFTVKTRAGKTLTCTANEKLQTPDGWLYLADFMPEDIRSSELILRSVCMNYTENNSAYSSDTSWKHQYEEDKKMCDSQDNVWVKIHTGQPYGDSFDKLKNLRLQQSDLTSNTTKAALYHVNNNDLVEDPIELIEFSGFKPVMDIETETYHNFFANGISVHNCHTLSEWSDNFRPSYQRCGEFIEEYNPKVVAAFTATATDLVISDVERVLKITDACICRYYPPRENLHLSSETLLDNNALYPAILRQVRRVKGSCIVYCQTVKEVSKLTSYLSQAGESVTFYHGQIQEVNLKDMNQDEFMSGRARICVATNAFGMGIDKPDIGGVIHAGPPGSVEAVTQETGRAARDGRDAICHMFMTPSGRWMQEFFWNSSNPDGHTVRNAYNYIRKVSNTDGVAHITGKDLCEAIESPSAEGALNYLQACGCVERFDSGVKLYVFTLQSSDPESIKPTYKKVYDLIQEGGSAAGFNEEGHKVYQLDIAWLVAKLNVLSQTVQDKLRQMKKDGHIDYIPPFRGKATRIISPPTKEDIDRADQKRSIEWKKIADVREYIETPDDKKHAFLQNYFMIDRNVIS